MAETLSETPNLAIPIEALSSAPSAAEDDPLWYKDAIIYQAHVKSFFDSSNDGIGDFQGLTQKLDYFQALGITCVWLLPFFPSPLKDDGYDIADYLNVHPSYGTLDDFKAFVRAAHERHIKVLIELVVNHTSDQHPWFQRARLAPAGSPERDFYVWSDTDKKFPGTRIIFLDTEKSNWTYDPLAGQYYWHRFFSHQPDLNHNNPAVVEAVIGVMKFWLDLGVDALRLDAVPYLCVREGTNNENLPETHEVLKRVRRELDATYKHRMLVAEANQWPSDVRAYFGDGDECHMAFHFPLMPRMFMALRQEDRHAITEILNQTPEIPETSQWALFLRNHDELTLEMVTDEERDYMYAVYAADPQMRLNLGIRRRLAPLMENSRRRVELLNSLLFSLPGTPILYYGDEIGMGDNIYLGDRNGVRTPMQWSSDRNGGFSRADPARLYAPPIMDPVYGYQAINVEAQERYPFSLLNWMKRLIAMRKQHRVLGRGALQIIYAANRKVFSFLRRDDHETILVVANLSRTFQPVELDLRAFAGLIPVEMAGMTEFPRITEHPYFLTLGAYASHWFTLQRDPMQVRPKLAPAADPDAAIADSVPALLVGLDWQTLLDGGTRAVLERQALRPFLQRQRWFASKSREIATARFSDWTLLRTGTSPAFVSLVTVGYADGWTETYLLPLALLTGEDAERALLQSPSAVLARVTGARNGVIIDGMQDDDTCDRLLDISASDKELATRRGSVRGRPVDGPIELTSDRKWVRGGDQSNSVAFVNERYVLKLFRRIEPGPNPDFELGRFLSERRFRHSPAILGGLEYGPPGLEPGTLGVVQTVVTHQGSGWQYTIDELRRYYERVAAQVGRTEGIPDRQPEGQEGSARGPSDPSTLLRVDLSLSKVEREARARASGGAASAPLALRRAWPKHASSADERRPGAPRAQEKDRQEGREGMKAEAPPFFAALENWYLESATMLGRRTAELHLTLADSDDPALAPEPLDAEAVDVLAGDMRARARAAFDLLDSRLTALNDVAGTQAEVVLANRDKLLARFDDIRRLGDAGLRIRIHGDYHLGQVLRTEEDFAILDFEGEPARSIAERRAKQSPLKDVAGMIRSYGYAAYAALFAFTLHAPDDFALLEPWADTWQHWAADAFLREYRATIGPAPLAPPREAFGALLCAFVLDKALYELGYELNNRPGWVRIPLTGILKLL